MGFEVLKKVKEEGYFLALNDIFIWLESKKETNKKELINKLKELKDVRGS